MNSIINRIFRGMKGGLYVNAYGDSDLSELEKTYNWEGVWIAKNKEDYDKFVVTKNCCVLYNVDNPTDPLYKPFSSALFEGNNSTLIHHMSLSQINPYPPLSDFYECERKRNEGNKYSWKKRIITLEVDSTSVTPELTKLLFDWSMIPVNVEHGKSSFVHKIFEVLL